MNLTIDSLMATLRSLPPAPPYIQSVPDFIRAQFRFPRSKSKRIRRKWAKRAENFRMADSGFPAGGLEDRENNVVYVRESVLQNLKEHRESKGYGINPRAMGSFSARKISALELFPHEPTPTVRIRTMFVMPPKSYIGICALA